MNLTPETARLVDQAIREVLAEHRDDELTGVSCIAAGADSIFARALLDLGGRLEIVLPAADYRDRKVGPNHLPVFDELVRQAANVTVMPFEESNREAYEAANAAMLAGVDQLVAVWDGQGAADKGGTGEVVRTARERRTPVTVVWPKGAKRD